jgi:hypothetical protein
MRQPRVKQDYLETIDVFGKSFEFTFGGKDQFKSHWGGYFTIFTFFVVVYMVWLLGKEILMRDMPKDSQVISIKNAPTNITWNVPTGFMVLDNRGTIFPNYDRYLTFESYYWNMQRNKVTGKFENVTEPLELDMVKCTPNDFSDEVYKNFIDFKMDTALCVANKGLKLGGDFGGEYARFVSVRVTPCYNTTKFNNCLPAEESLSFLNLKNLVVSVKSEKILYKSKDFSKPVNKFIGEDNILIDPYIFNFPRYQINEFIVDTDSGLIGQSTNADTYYEYSFLNDIITAFDNDGLRPKDLRKLILYEYTFFESYNQKTQIRSYLKLTDMLASVGGILKIYILIFNFFFHQIYQRMMYEKVITQLFNFEKVSKFGLKRGDDGGNEKKQIEKIFQPQPSRADTYKPSEVNLQSEKSEVTTKPLRKQYTIFQKDNYLTKGDQENEMISPLSTNNRMKSPSILTNNAGPQDKGNPFSIANRNSAFSASTVSVLFAKNKMKNEKRNRQIFSIMNHINLSFFPFCTCCSRNLRSINDKFKRLIDYMHNYIDVLQMMKQFHELERLKFVLFNKKQLSIFQNIGIPEDPLHMKKIDRINTLYKFQYDKNAQKKKAQEFFKDTQGENESKLDQRLKKLYLNN